jgi:hypothetical protein
VLANLLRPNCPDVLDRRWVLVGHYTHHHPNDIQTTSKRNFCIYFFTPRLSPSSFIRFVPSFDCMDHSAEVFDLDSCGPCNKHVGTFVSLPGPPPLPPNPSSSLALQFLYLASRAADTRKMNRQMQICQKKIDCCLFFPLPSLECIPLISLLHSGSPYPVFFLKKFKKFHPLYIAAVKKRI